MYQSILTAVGRAKLMSATPEQQLLIAQIAVGDGDGRYQALNENMTSLVREVWRGPASAPVRDTVNPSLLLFSVSLPPDAGDFFVREIAIFDAAGNMIGIGQTHAVQQVAATPGNPGAGVTVQFAVQLQNAVQVELVYTANPLDLEARTELLRQDVQGFDSYSKIRAYSGQSTRQQVRMRDGVMRWFSRRGDRHDNDATVLIDANGESWECEFSGPVLLAWFMTGEVHNACYAAWMREVMLHGEGSTTGVEQVTLTAAPELFFSAVKSLKIDHSGTVLKFNINTVSTNYRLLRIENGADFSGSVFDCTGFNFNLSGSAYVEPIGTDTSVGIGGLAVSGFETVCGDGYVINDSFFGYGLSIQGFTFNFWKNLNFKRVGEKKNPLSDDVSAGDAAGDAIYTGNFVGKAVSVFENLNAESYDGGLRAGRACIVSEVFTEDAISHDITVINGNANGYQRTVHLEDGGISSIAWNGGDIKNTAAPLFALHSPASGRKEDLAVFKGVIVDIGVSPTYGGVKGISNIQATGRAVYENSHVVLKSGGSGGKGSVNLVNSTTVANTSYSHAGKVEYVSGSANFHDSAHFAIYGASGDTVLDVKGTDVKSETFTNVFRLMTTNTHAKTFGGVWDNAYVSGNDRCSVTYTGTAVSLTPSGNINFGSPLFSLFFNGGSLHSSIALSLNGDYVGPAYFTGADMMNIKLSSVNALGSRFTKVSGGQMRYNSSFVGEEIFDLWSGFIHVAGASIVDERIDAKISIPANGPNSVWRGTGNVLIDKDGVELLI